MNDAKLLFCCAGAELQVRPDSAAARAQVKRLPALDTVCLSLLQLLFNNAFTRYSLGIYKKKKKSTNTGKYPTLKGFLEFPFSKSFLFQLWLGNIGSVTLRVCVCVCVCVWGGVLSLTWTGKL